MSYTLGMKTAVSIPDDVYNKAEAMAKRTNRSRSKLYAEALRSYLAQHDQDSITEAYNQLADEGHLGIDPFVDAAGRATLERVEWQ